MLEVLGMRQLAPEDKLRLASLACIVILSAHDCGVGSRDQETPRQMGARLP